MEAFLLALAGVAGLAALGVLGKVLCNASHNKKETAIPAKTDQELGELLTSVRGAAVRAPIDIGSKYLAEYIYRLILDTTVLLQVTYILLFVTLVMLAATLLNAWVVVKGKL